MVEKLKVALKSTSKRLYHKFLKYNKRLDLLGALKCIFCMFHGILFQVIQTNDQLPNVTVIFICRLTDLKLSFLLSIQPVFS